LRQVVAALLITMLARMCNGWYNCVVVMRDAQLFVG
jgi:hypothetical protein